MAKSFREFLDAQKKATPDVKEKVNIASAGTTFYLNHIKEKGLGQNYIADRGISQAAVKLTDEFRGGIEELDGSDYRGFVSFVRKFESALNELPKNRNLSSEDREYVESAIRDPLAQIATIRGPVLRLAYGLEDFKKQFKPLKLADRLLGDVPIIGNMIKSKIEDIEAGEEAVIRAGREAAKAKAREFRKSLGLDDDDMGEFAPADDVIQPTAGSAAEFEQQVTDERLEDRGRSDFMSTGAKKNKTEEQRKEANFEREQTQNIFEAIMANTAETNEILKELIEVNEEIKEGSDGTSLLELLGAQQALKKGGKLLKGGGAVATAAGSTIAAKKALSTSKKATPKGDKLKKSIKKVAPIAKNVAKGALAKVPWLLPIIGAYDVISGAAGAEEILEAAPDEEVSFFDRLGAGIGKLVETTTFGLVDAKSAANFLGAEAEKKVDTTADVAAATTATDLASTYTIDANLVNLKADQLRLGTLDNVFEKMNNDMSDMASFFNSQIVNNNSNQTTVLPPISSNNNDQSITVVRNNLYK